MTIKPIRNDDDLKRAFRRLEKVFQAEEGTAQADERDVLVTLVEAYENKHYDFGQADPVEAIKCRMEQGGLTPRKRVAMAHCVTGGSSIRVSLRAL